MNDRSLSAALTLSIAAVERDTGLSKDTLRVWERRYGFPTPARDDIGERAYPLDQVEKLRILKRLLDAGHRPGRIVPLSAQALQQLSQSTLDKAAELPSIGTRNGPPALSAADIGARVALIRAHDPSALRHELSCLLARYGVARFVAEVVGPLNAAVGDAWMRGQLEIFEEHLYTEAIQSVLRQAIAGLGEPVAADAPRVLMTTFPGEPHGLGLLMAQAVFALESCRCISLGVETPLWDIVLAAGAYRADIVALSFTGCMGPNQVFEGLVELRGKLPATVQLWAGGSAPVLHRRRIDGVRALATLDGVPVELARWRERAASVGGDPACGLPVDSASAAASPMLRAVS